MPVKGKGEIRVDNQVFKNILWQDFMTILLRNTGPLRILLSTVLAVLVALIISGAEYAVAPGLERGIAQIQADEHERILSAEFPGGHFTIAESGKTNAGSVFFLTLPAAIGGNGLDNNQPDARSISCRLSANLNLRCSQELTTAAIISPEKAEELTLVGAKPSGTS